MNVIKQSAVSIVAIVGLSVASMAVATNDYEYNAGQSAQLNQIMKELPSNKPLDRSGWRGNEVSEAKKNAAEEIARERNMLGQSSAMTRTKPYVDLYTKKLEGSYDQGGAAHSPLHERPAVGNRIDK